MLLLHIGSEKTGSSSIQWLLRKPAFTSATEVVRLRAGPEWGQITFVNALHTNSSRNTEVRAALSGMADQVNGAPAKTYVLSNEVLFRRGVAATLADALGSKVSVPVKVICYLRRPDTYLEASYKQRVKNGRIEPGALKYLRERDELDFNGILNEYATQFGVENIIVRPYERKRFPEGDVVRDFLSLIGVNSLPKDLEVTLARNRSLSAIASELVGVVARKNRNMHQDTLSYLNNSPNDGLRRSGDVYTLAERQAIMAECETNLDQVHKTYLPHVDSMFDMTDLADCVVDPYPSAEERLILTRAASEEIIARLCKIGKAAEAAGDGIAKAQRTERTQRRRADRRAALGRRE